MSTAGHYRGSSSGRLPTPGHALYVHLLGRIPVHREIFWHRTLIGSFKVAAVLDPSGQFRGHAGEDAGQPPAVLVGWGPSLWPSAVVHPIQSQLDQWLTDSPP